MRETEWNGCIYLIVFVCIWFCIWMRFHWIWLNLYEFVCICLFSSSPTKGQKINTHSQDFINFHCNAHRCWGRGLLHRGLASSKSVTFPACQMHPNATMLGWWPGQVVVIKIWNYFEGCWMVLIEFQWFFWWTWWPLIFFIPLNSIPWAQKLSWPVQSQERQWSDDAPSLLLEHAAWQFVEGLGGVEGAHARKPHPYLQWELDEINSDELKRFNIIRKKQENKHTMNFHEFSFHHKVEPDFQVGTALDMDPPQQDGTVSCMHCGILWESRALGCCWLDLSWVELKEFEWTWLNLRNRSFPMAKVFDLLWSAVFLNCFHVFHFSTYFEVSWSWMKFRTCIWMHLVSGVFCQGPQVVEVWSCINSEYGAGTVVDSLCLLRCRWLRCAGSATIGRRYHMLNSRGVAARQKIIWGGVLGQKDAVRRMQSQDF